MSYLERHWNKIKLFGLKIARKNSSLDIWTKSILIGRNSGILSVTTRFSPACGCKKKSHAGKTTTSTTCNTHLSRRFAATPMKSNAHSKQNLVPSIKSAERFVAIAGTKSPARFSGAKNSTYRDEITPVKPIYLRNLRPFIGVIT